MSVQRTGIQQSIGVPAATAIVGRQEDLAFALLITMLRSRRDVQIIGEFPTLHHATVAGLGRELIADLVIVLQSFSDEFAQDEVNDLIGLMLHHRILCCYGPWCVSDDRTHAIWPAANRVAADSAETVIAMELSEFTSGATPLSPMSAGEEVFAHRTQLLPRDKPSMGPNESVLVVSDDITLRNTAANICRALGHCVTTADCASDSFGETVRGLSSSLRFVLVDLDAQADGMIVPAVLAAVRSVSHVRAERFVRGTNNDNVKVIGMTVFAEPPPDADALDAVIDKTDLMTQLQWLLSVR